MWVVRSTGVSAMDGANSQVVWRLAFSHACPERSPMADATCVVDRYVRRQLLGGNAVCLQKRCGCGVTLSREDRQTLQEVWEIQARLAGEPDLWHFANTQFMQYGW